MNLPEELIVKILVEYHGGFSYRTGKLIAKIPENDSRMQIVFPHPSRYITPRGNIIITLTVSPTKFYLIQFLYYYSWSTGKIEANETMSFTEQTDEGVIISRPVFYKN